MIFHVGGARLTPVRTLLAAGLAFVAATDAGFAKDDVHKANYARFFTIVSNGIVTSSILNGPDGLEVSSNAPGMITVASGSQAISLRGDYVTLSGDVAFAPVATPGVTVTANAAGGYTVVLDIPMEADLGR
ncbi:MAG TPA: hypothetical protein VEJ43_00455 [Pseudolabrys sp.]|nr:hypothetical protein [Pseudolabrys sp.]